MAGLVAHLTSIAVVVGSIPAGSVEESEKCISGDRNSLSGVLVEKERNK